METNLDGTWNKRAVNATIKAAAKVGLVLSFEDDGEVIIDLEKWFDDDINLSVATYKVAGGCLQFAGCFDAITECGGADEDWPATLANLADLRTYLPLMAEQAKLVDALVG